MGARFKTKAGRLTFYAFACGYIERKEDKNLTLDLWHEGACFHVRAHEFNGRGRLFWECFENLTSARGFFDKQKKELFKKLTPVKKFDRFLSDDTAK